MEKLADFITQQITNRNPDAPLFTMISGTGKEFAFCPDDFVFSDFSKSMEGLMESISPIESWKPGRVGVTHDEAKALNNVAGTIAQ